MPGHLEEVRWVWEPAQEVTPTDEAPRFARTPAAKSLLRWRTGDRVYQ